MKSPCYKFARQVPAATKLKLSGLPQEFLKRFLKKTLVQMSVNLGWQHQLHTLGALMPRLKTSSGTSVWLGAPWLDAMVNAVKFLLDRWEFKFVM